MLPMQVVLQMVDKLMFILDLKLSLFVGLLGVVGSIFGIIWFLQQRAYLRAKATLNVSWQLCETLPFGILILEPDNRIRFTNALAKQLLHDISGTSPNDIQKTLKRFNQPGAGEDNLQSGLIQQQVFVKWWRYPLAEGQLIILSEANHYQHSIRHQAFIGQLGHELRTPLTALIAHAAVLDNIQTSEVVRQSSVHIIQRETERMARLIRDMMELHRLETGEDLPLHPVNVVLVAEIAVAQLILSAEERNIELIFGADTGLPLVLAQPDRLKQVFLNLIDNAIKYCRAGDEIRVLLKRQADGVLCEVQDSGPGIAAADLPRVTELLYRSRKDVEGYGIGLALVREILRRHNATFTIDSSTNSPHSGTACRWLLPYNPIA